MKLKYILILAASLGALGAMNPDLLNAQSAMININGRRHISLDGTWRAIVDPMEAGDWRQVWLEKKPREKTDFTEYSFEGGSSLRVPGDFNTQLKELTYFEGSVWYKKNFRYRSTPGRRLFLHFGAVNYLASVYLNGKLLGTHEGGFTPFQFELTSLVVAGENAIIVRVNNQRRKDGVPGLGFDWFNYGGITRDVNLVETRETFIEDYFIQLKKHSLDEVLGWIQLNGGSASQTIQIRIPELHLDYKTASDNRGIATVAFSARFKLWTPQDPKLYKVIIQSETDTITDNIGFRSIEVRGTRLFLNDKPIFLKAVNMHEERARKGGRAYSEADDRVLLSWAKELGCNMVRLAHYPHNENMVRLAEKMGIMVWDEIPVYQHIEFALPGVSEKMELMMKEMLRRDRNRCAVIVWSLSNETSSSPKRDSCLIELSRECRSEDSSRLITSVISDQNYHNNLFTVWDTLCRYVDVIALNEYLGWYEPWQGKPSDVKWQFACEKPLILSEFGGEAKYGNHRGKPDEAAYWREEYQEKIYKDQIEMFLSTPGLAGVCAWILIDYRSPVRMHPVYQGGYNRKGLLSESGEKKKAWWVLKHFYETASRTN